MDIGIDYTLLLKHCHWRERVEYVYRVLMLFLSVMFLLGIGDFWNFISRSDQYDIGWGWLSILSLSLAAVGGGIWRARMIVPVIRKLDYGLRLPAEEERLYKSDTIGIHDTRPQNLIIYHDFDPFSFAGTVLTRWNIAIDLGKGRKNGTSDRVTPLPVDPSELEAFILAALSRACPPDTARDLYFVFGEEARMIPLGVHTRTPSTIDVEVARKLESKYPDLIKRYHWILHSSWAGDIDISSFIRCSASNQMLYFQHLKYIMGPIKQEHRSYDYVNVGVVEDWRMWAEKFKEGLFLGIIHMFGKPFEIFYGMDTLKNDEKQDNEYEKLLARNPRYNVGAAKGLREEYSDTTLLHYWQRGDIDLTQASIDRMIMSAMLDFLEQHDIDVSDIQNSTSVIMNSGIIVHQGNVSAQTLAVGEHSNASTSTGGGSRQLK